MIWFLAVLTIHSLETVPATRECTPSELRELTTPSDQPYRLVCRARLLGGTISRRILIEGPEASGAALDCGGGRIEQSRTATMRAPTVAIWSRLEGEHWLPPVDVSISNCTIAGNIRIWGMFAGGRLRDLFTVSRIPNYTELAQAASPSNVTLSHIQFEAAGIIPLYVGQGTTGTRLLNSTLTGWSNGTAIYLDAESRGAEIRGNVFNIRTSREQIAVDGSAYNQIEGNRFALGGKGGIFLYRNCGEAGVIRHQTPSYNQIMDNVFTGADRMNPQTVVVGSREGNRPYCAADAGYPFGSSADDGDGATHNRVADNRTE